MPEGSDLCHHLYATGRTKPEPFTVRAVQQRRVSDCGSVEPRRSKGKITLCLLMDVFSFKNPLLSSLCLPKPTLLGIALKRVCKRCHLYANATAGKVTNTPSACCEGTRYVTALTSHLSPPDSKVVSVLVPLSFPGSQVEALPSLSYHSG